MNFDTDGIKYGLCLVCNREGQIVRVPFDDLQIVPESRLPAQFSDIIDQDSLGKAADFWEEILNSEFVFDYELYLKQDEEPVPLHFSAATFDGQVWIIAAANDEVLEKMLNEMMLINNEQQNIIRQKEKELSKIEQRSAPSIDTFDEISKVNNDLINAQRKLIKRNSEISNLNEKLNRSNKELEQFAYAVSHDLKEPLRMVSSFMQLLEKKYSDKLDEKGHEYIHFAVDGAKRMTEMISSLLDYSRIGRENVTFEHLDLNEVMQQVTKLNLSVIEEHNGRVEWADLPVIYGQKVPLQQLFNNLISNALKYRKSGTAPVVEIEFEEKPKKWLFSVADNGRGIDPKHQDTIFNLFEYNGHAAHEKGSGIGLAICKKVVKHHGGEIWVESEEGKGSTFYFTIAKEH